MEKLLQILQKYSLQDALEIEKSDGQFIALQKLNKNLKNKEIFLPLIIANATTGYMLSSSGENYWQEFGEYFSKCQVESFEEIILKIKKFLPLSVWNKRLNTHKNLRLEKLSPFILTYDKNKSKFESDISHFHREISRHMNQKRESKTITFTVKMYSYGLRIIKNKDIIVPFEVEIPIDSRLTKIYELYKGNFSGNIRDFYIKLSKKTNIPPIHLDGILWTKFNKLVK